MNYESLFRHLFYPFYETVLRRRKTFTYYRQYMQHQWLEREALESLQWHALDSLLQHCFNNVPYYKRTWTSLDIHPADIKNINDFSKLPVLTKEIVRQNYDDLIAVNFRGKTMSKATGGSTGVPFRFEYTRESYERRMAVAWRGYEWAGLPLGRRTAYLWGADLGAQSRAHQLKTGLYHWFFNRKMLNSFVMSRENMSDYVGSLNNYRPEGIVSYVTPLYTLAGYILENGLRVHSPGVVITGAEPLYEFQRELIQSAFSCPVMNTYGCREFMLIGAECSEQNGLHVNQDHLVVETLDPLGNSVLEVSGSLAITDLYNYGMPLVRYLNGDLATLTQADCPCGRQMPLMKTIEGRELDAIRTVDGMILPGEFFPHLLKDFVGVEAFQVVQETLEGVTIYLVKNASLSHEDIHVITSELQKITGPLFKITFEFVDEIKLTASGKRRVTVSRLG